MMLIYVYMHSISHSREKECDVDMGCLGFSISAMVSEVKEHYIT